MKNEMSDQFFSLTYEFLNVYLKLQMCVSPDTVESYRDALTVFRRFLLNEQKIPIAKFLFENCNRDMLLNFMDYLKECGNKPGTRNQRLAVIKAYLWFAADKDIALQSVALQASRIRACKNPITEKPIIPENALALLLRQPDNSRMGLRDRTIMILLYDSAVRLAEVLSLKVRDVCLKEDNSYIRVLGKGHKERVVAITSQTAEHIREYIANYHSNSHLNTDLLFYTVIKGNAGKMSEGNVERFLSRYADDVRKICADMPMRVYPHMLRRTRATNLYRNGVELPLISRILGHAQLETTRIYATPSLEMMRTVLEDNIPPEVKCEKPLWDSTDEEQMARLCGLR